MFTVPKHIRSSFIYSLSLSFGISPTRQSFSQCFPWQEGTFGGDLLQPSKDFPPSAIFKCHFKRRGVLSESIFTLTVFCGWFPTWEKCSPLLTVCSIVLKTVSYSFYPVLISVWNISSWNSNKKKDSECLKKHFIFITHFKVLFLAIKLCNSLNTLKVYC